MGKYRRGRDSQECIKGLQALYKRFYSPNRFTDKFDISKSRFGISFEKVGELGLGPLQDSVNQGEGVHLI